MPAAVLGRGMTTAATNLLIKASGTLGPLRFSECRGAEYFRRLALELDLKGPVDTGGILTRHLGRTDSLEILGQGEIDAKLRHEYASGKEAHRTAQAYEVWRDEYLTQVAVAWVLGCVFVRFLEDNELIDTPRLAGPGGDRERLGSLGLGQAEQVASPEHLAFLAAKAPRGEWPPRAVSPAMTSASGLLPSTRRTSVSIPSSLR